MVEYRNNSHNMKHNKKQRMTGIHSNNHLESLSRRHFLMASAAGISLAMPAILNAAESVSAFTRKIKLGLVGAGGRGSWIAQLFKRHGGYIMHAVADYFPQVAQKAGDALGVEASRCFSGLDGYKRLIASGVEAVALETPPWFLPFQAQAAAAAGLHVYMAKPVAVDVPGCRIIEQFAQDAKAQKRCFLVDYQMPTDPDNKKIMQMIQEGEIGKVLAINSHYYAGQFNDPPLSDTIESRLQSLIWVNDIALGGGYHVNACIHAVDAALWAANARPISASGYSRTGRPDPHGDSHDIFSFVFEFANGLIWTHRGKHLNNMTGFDVSCEIQGETGYAETRYGGKVFLKSRENGFNGESVNLYEAGATRNIAKFYNQIIQEDFSHDTVKRSIDGALVTILAREAGRRRTTLTLETLMKENARLDVNLSGLRT
jgi:predicted dehydrogenase